MKQSLRIIDISLPIGEKMVIFPNNPPVKFKPLRTPTTYISEITFGSHTGTHIDVPRHISKKGIGVDKINLDQLIGPCRVLDMTHCKVSITTDDFRKEDIQKQERILVKTNNSLKGFKKFYPDYIYLDGDAAEFLASKKIVLFGIDSLSVKKQGSPDTRPHTELLKNNIVIIEGLDLSEVTPGQYDIFCLPLKLVGFDGAPARTILINST
ncbi:cyclase family protein [Candidatus Microgenomates bacterium]|nr:cyclase family protein [Candidatus Microgenomates bacterium]